MPSGTPEIHQSESRTPGNRLFETTPEDDSYDGSVVEYLVELAQEPTILFERDLDRLGLLSRLEDSGILPAVESPNPYDPRHDEQRHEAWWSEHPEKEAEFGQISEAREISLKYLLLGSVLGSLYVLYPRRKRQEMSDQLGPVRQDA